MGFHYIYDLNLLGAAVLCKLRERASTTMMKMMQWMRWKRWRMNREDTAYCGCPCYLCNRPVYISYPRMPSVDCVPPTWQRETTNSTTPLPLRRAGRSSWNRDEDVLPSYSSSSSSYLCVTFLLSFTCATTSSISTCHDSRSR